MMYFDPEHNPVKTRREPGCESEGGKMKKYTVIIAAIIWAFCGTAFSASNTSYDFESGWSGWYADNGVWEIGSPSVGPSSCHGGEQCAGTILDGNYPSYTDSRLISPSITLATSPGDDEIFLWFWHSFSYGDRAAGYIQVSIYNESSGTWSDWEGIGSSITGTSLIWSYTGVDLSVYAGKKVKIAFYHMAHYRQGAGWYIDDIEITRTTFCSNGGCTAEELEAQYDTGYAAGKQLCMDDPASCDIEVGGDYDAGYAAGKQLCMDDPASCDIEVGGDYDDGYAAGRSEGYDEGFQAGAATCDDCETPVEDNCASFNLFTNTLHVPCLDFGDLYWLNLKLTDSDPIMFELKDFGINE